MEEQELKVSNNKITVLFSFEIDRKDCKLCEFRRGRGDADWYKRTTSVEESIPSTSLNTRLKKKKKKMALGLDTGIHVC